MTKGLYNILALVFISFQFIAAQNNSQAEKIIVDLLTDAKVNAIKTAFKLTYSPKSNSQEQVATGTFTIKGNKFVLEMNEMKVFFDGKTQWSYLTQNNEVSITEPSEKELSETNPMAILSGFKTKSSIRFSSKTTTPQNYCIEMLTKLKNQDISKIEVQVNKSTNNLVSIKLFNKNGSTSHLSLQNFQKEVKVADNEFIFIVGKHKGVVVNDLR